MRKLLADLARDNPPAAARYVDALRESCGKLADFPEAGPAYDERYRRLVFRNHLIFYTFDNERHRVAIVAVIDARRDVDRIL
jgi:plasmid stabilization system protein ParE